MATCDPLWDLLDQARQRWNEEHIRQCQAAHDAGIRQCAREEDRGHKQCTEQADKGYNSCTATRDEGYSQCCDWWPCSWLCDLVVWISNIVCVLWTWIQQLVCVAWTWIKNVVCVAWTEVTRVVCRLATFAINRVLMHLIALGRLLCPIYKPFLDARRKHICQSVIQSVATIPRLESRAFSVAAVPSRFEYHDSGRRYDFRIVNGAVQVSDDFEATWQDVASQAISFDSKRSGTLFPSPRFDLVAANAGRVIAKEEGTDRFFFAIVDPMFWQFADANAPRIGIDGPPAVARGAEIVVPSTYFKLDPEEGMAGRLTADLLAPFAGNFNAHPAAERFHFFGALLAAKEGLLGEFFHGMVVRVEPRRWYLIDTRPPPGTSRVPNGIPSYEQVVYCDPFGERSSQCAIAFDSVLDIGVGHTHWHEQYDWTFGGEMQGLRSQGLFGVPVLTYYQLFNGPVVDGDGFVDGTCNYYALCRLNRHRAQSPGCDALPQDDTSGTASAQRFALLFVDEQSLFSQRWRLAHPSDYEGLLFALVPDLHRTPNPYDFDIRSFWCPFRANCITDQSRLAVARQVIVVNGRDPTTKLEELYSINFSWDTSDRTWRWRTLPRDISPGVLLDTDVSQGLETIIPDDKRPDSAYLQTVRVREDTTIHVKGTHAASRGAPIVGRWFQKYLPSDAQPVPSPDQLQPAIPGPPTKPTIGYSHAWQFLPEATFQRADRFSHFGVYMPVDSRSQYYALTISESQELQFDERARWEDVDHRLGLRRAKFDWEVLTSNSSAATNVVLDSVATAFEGSPGLDAVIWGLPTRTQFFRSFYTPDLVALRLANRGPLGWIGTHWDKRDDDLDRFDGLPMTVTLALRGRDRRLRVTLTDQVRLWSVPAVRAAAVRMERTAAGRLVRAVVSFQSVFATALLQVNPRLLFDGTTNEENAIWSNIWRVRIAAVPLAGGVRHLFDRVAFDSFAFRAGSDGWFDAEWIPADAAEAQEMLRYCSATGRLDDGTSIWFEDIIGHVGTAEMTTFATD